MTAGRRRILVVEDDRETAEQIVDSLATSGYQVDLAVDGNDGLNRARSAKYAVMTIDRMLPGIDGVAIIQCLRRDGIVTPALIVSALGEIDDRVRGLRAGRSPSRNCWPASRLSPDAAIPSSRKRCCASAIWSSTWCRER